jgi:hypothetical protein
MRGKGGQNARLTTLQPSCAGCLEILGALTSWKPIGTSRPAMGLLYLGVPQDRMLTIGRMISM